MDPWPFDQPRNCATITVWRILKRLDPITYVSHEEDDHSWQFLNTGGGRSLDIKDAAIVSLENIIKFDPSMLAMADLPPGWHAERPSPDAPWQRAKSPPDTDL